MRHDPERDAARFLAGTMSSARRHDFSEHLLSCQPCWQEVQQARAGRAALEAARQVAPAELRDRIRALVEAHQEPGSATATPLRRRRRWLPAAGLAAAAALVAATLTLAPSRLSSPPAPSPVPQALQLAVDDYHAQRLPGTGMTDSSAPDLSALQLRPVGTGAGAYHGLAVEAYAYIGPAGRRVAVYLSAEPFPEPAGAVPVHAAGGPWTAHQGDITALCAMLPASLAPADPAVNALLVIGRDPALVAATARNLGAL